MYVHLGGLAFEAEDTDGVIESLWLWYYYSISHREANVVVDALSRKWGSMWSFSHLQVSRLPFAKEIQTLVIDFMSLKVIEKEGLMACVEAIYSFHDKIKGK